MYTFRFCRLFTDFLFDSSFFFLSFNPFKVDSAFDSCATHSRAPFSSKAECSFATIFFSFVSGSFSIHGDSTYDIYFLIARTALGYVESRRNYCRLFDSSPPSPSFLSMEYFLFDTFLQMNSKFNKLAACTPHLRS